MFHLRNCEAHRVSVISPPSEFSDNGLGKQISKDEEWDHGRLPLLPTLNPRLTLSLRSLLALGPCSSVLLHLKILTLSHPLLVTVCWASLPRTQLCLVLTKMLSGVGPSIALLDEHFRWRGTPSVLQEGGAGCKECRNVQHSEMESQYGDIFCNVHAEVHSEMHQF